MNECGFCHKTFRDIVAHIRTHTGEKPFKCETCSKAFKRSSQLTSHRLVHTGERSFRCEICDKCFARNSDLNRHLKMHTGEKPFECELCHKRFTCHRNLVYHKATHERKVPPKSKLHTNELHGESFTDGVNVLMETHSRKKINTSKKTYECGFCCKSIHQSHIIAHIRMHTEKLFICEICSKPFKLLSQLVCHRKIHAEKEPSECKFCKKAFTRNSDLKRHIIVVHANSKSFKCELCDKTFACRQYLIRHEAKHHKQKTPVESKPLNDELYRESFSNEIDTLNEVHFKSIIEDAKLSSQVKTKSDNIDYNQNALCTEEFIKCENYNEQQL